MYKKLLIILFIAFAINVNGQRELKYDLDSIVVTSNRIPVNFSEIGRSLDVVSSKEIELLPVTGIQDLLEFSSGLDIKQRGPEDVQADISIRGGSFEQTLILIDGIKLIDPQTGHHNMNLPISFSQVEKIEILKGQGSRIYGANAFGGVINIIPKRNNFNSLNIELNGGENSYYKFGINGSIKLGSTNHNVSYSRSKSDGYRINTEFENNSISLNNSFNFSSAVIKTIFGYTEKDFGANSYYTTRFPNQAEKTKTILAGLSGEITTGDFIFSPKLFWRNNKDEFVLDKFNHSFYKNNHETNVYGSELQASTNILGGATTFGVEFTQDDIVSNNLGEHKRHTNGFFIEQKIKVSNNINLSMGGFAYHYTQLNWKFWPGIDIAYSIVNNMKIFANYGRAFRIPTYTELFYSDPVTNGNPNLVPEESNNYEIGFHYQNEFLTASSSAFRKEGKNLIDYVLDKESSLWNAKNFTEINTNGIELGLQFNLSNVTNNIINYFAINYTYLNSDKEDLNIDSRYVLEHLEHDLSFKVFHSLPYAIKQSWTINYEERLTLEEHFTVDTKLVRKFKLFEVFVKASNLFNKSYEEIPGVTLPGRWIIGGVKFSVL